MKKNKTYRTLAMCLLMAVSLGTQAQVKTRRACNITEQTSTKQAGVTRLHSDKKQQLRMAEDADMVRVKIEFQRDDIERYEIAEVMIYNLNWSAKWYPSAESETPVHGMIVTIPKGTYDILTNTMDYYENGQPYIHIKEQVDITDDTTIVIDVVDCPHLFSWEFYTHSGEKMELNVERVIGHYPWDEVVKEGNIESIDLMDYIVLDQYGPVYSYYVSTSYEFESSNYPFGSFFVNDHSNRYQSHIELASIGRDGYCYVNKASSIGADYPLRNTPDDYVLYEEKLQMTPMGKKTVAEPLGTIKMNVYENVSKEEEIITWRRTPIADDHKVKVLINAPKEESEDGFHLNISTQVRAVDYIESFDEEYEDEDENGEWIQWTSTKYMYHYLTGPEMMVGKDHSFEYLVNGGSGVDNKTSEYNVWKSPDYPAHPKFSFSPAQKKGIMGNSCPLNVITSNGIYLCYYDTNRIRLWNGYNGRYGEENENGNIYNTLNVKYNGESIYDGPNELDSLCWAWIEEKRPDGNYEITYNNQNVEVDGLAGKNITTISFDQTRSDWDMPVMKMLQFRDADNNVTDRFTSAAEGTIMLVGGDFQYHRDTYEDGIWDWMDCQPMTMELYYAPYGTDEWHPLTVEHQAEYDDIPGMGFFYSGTLADVTAASANGWFDLKFTLTDEAGNWQTQTLSPAFHIEDLTDTGISTQTTDDTRTETARYNTSGQRITSPQHGLTIVRYSDGTTRKVMTK